MTSRQFTQFVRVSSPATPKVRSCWAGPVVAAATLAIAAGQATAGPLLLRETVALSNMLLPGANDGSALLYFDSPVIDAQGRVAFSTTLQGPQVTDDNSTAVVYGAPGQLTSLRSGEKAPDDEELTLQIGSRPVLSQAGSFASIGNLVGPGVDFTNSSVGYVGAPGSFQRFARASEPAPGADEGTVLFDLFQNTQRVNNAGQVVYQAGLDGPDVTFENNQGIYTYVPGVGNQVVARQGDPAAGVPGATYFFAALPLLSPSGQIIFSGFTEKPDPNGGASVIESAIWSRDPQGQTRVVARQGEPAPGYAPDVRIEATFQPRLNNSGTTVYGAYVTGPGLDLADSFAVYADRPNASTDELLFRTGTQAPLTAPGININGFGDMAFNAQNSLAFGAELTGPGIDFSNDTALYVRRSDASWSMIAREGAPVPEVPGATYGSLTFGSPSLNAAGQVAFYGSIVLPQTDEFGNPFIAAALWVWDPTAGLSMVAKTGDVIEVAPGDFRQIAQLTLDSVSLGSGLEDGRRSSFNDAGQLAFSAFFTDDTIGVFRTSIVPTPGAALLLCGVAAGAMSRRRRM